MKVIRSTNNVNAWSVQCASWLLVVLTGATIAFGQTSTTSESDSEDNVPEVAEQVEVEPLAEDVDISGRLTRILEATEWFQQPDVRVDEGVVFLSGSVEDIKHKEWAGRLAQNTQDVVAVVNQINVLEGSIWNLSPAWNEVEELAADTVRSTPLLGVGLILLIAAWFAAGMSVQAARYIFSRRITSRLLRDVAARAVAVPVFLLGIYLVLKVSGLTRLAMTVLGGTGIIGLVVGFAFRDIAENFLASVLISLQHPFTTGDLVEVAGYQGYVQSVNTRATLLMTLEGNHVQIPNATIYKETITNFTSNPHTRSDFVVGIGYDDSLTHAQSIALDVLRDHPAVVSDPEPLVLVEALGAATVNLRVYFWIDSSKYSLLKVRSAVVRLTKSAFEDAGISMPDEAREVVFPSGVPVRMLADDADKNTVAVRPTSPPHEAEPTAHSAEGDLRSEADEINQQARQARTPEAGENLLDS
ncbi:MAG: mechanosensitive ion channel [Planctomycetaceae bacterium]|nr:mechanosensitive ion channel [Planctomycetales bacterium]MCB9875813.1 mechanosensitive ion channel [Planctomycetaceae bacterium]MCB9940660.1 mechanosensitive ion channel [Planctomycetaceae bacterium]